MSTIESVLHEDRIFEPSNDFVKQANVSGLKSYETLCAAAEKDYEGFWAGLAKEHLLWNKPFSKTLDSSN
ncbi:MAG: acetyl-coenzyme A synthetase N-terminal domain-containing protein, partial [Betaproteobacteria bacterium]